MDPASQTLQVPTSTVDTYVQRSGAIFRGLINDLKRNEQAAADELGVEVGLIREIIAGDRPVPMELIEEAVRIWPVSERDFFTLRDDAPEGIIVLRAEESEASSRTFQRGGKDYYEYRDTAMSRAAMIRPEWIRMLHTVDDNDADNPTVQWNNGHFLYQFTYFIGEVNYYYADGGRRHCAPMSTGDSVFGLPFARHSFAVRRPAERGLILALTYGGRLLGDAQHELGLLGEEKACRFVLPIENPTSAQGSLLAMHAANGSYTSAYLSQATGLSRARVESLMAGEEAADFEALNALAGAMRLPLRELLPSLPDTSDGVVIVRGGDAARWHLPDSNRPAYRVKELAGSRVTPFSKSLELEVLGGAAAQPCELETGLHQYGYHIGPEPVILTWRNRGLQRETILQPGDSFCTGPFVPHWFTPLPEVETFHPRLLLLRVGGKVVGDTRLEASILGPDSLKRVVAETDCWYNSMGSGPEARG